MESRRFFFFHPELGWRSTNFQTSFRCTNSMSPHVAYDDRPTGPADIIVFPEPNRARRRAVAMSAFVCVFRVARFWHFQRSRFLNVPPPPPNCFSFLLKRLPTGHGFVTASWLRRISDRYNSRCSSRKPMYRMYDFQGLKKIKKKNNGSYCREWFWRGFASEQGFFKIPRTWNKRENQRENLTSNNTGIFFFFFFFTIQSYWWRTLRFRKNSSYTKFELVSSDKNVLFVSIIIVDRITTINGRDRTIGERRGATYVVVLSSVLRFSLCSWNVVVPISDWLRRRPTTTTTTT